jgi:hypothetical protein
MARLKPCPSFDSLPQPLRAFRCFMCYPPWPTEKSNLDKSETDHFDVESRRACPELVERGRLNLAQDAVLGCHAVSKSPAGTTEKYRDAVLDPAERIGNSQLCWDCPRVTSSRPYGTFRLSNLYPGLRPGLSSAVPVRQAQGRLCGTHFAIGRFSRKH